MTVLYETKRLTLRTFEDEYLEATKSFWGDEDVMALCSGATTEEFLSQIILGYRKCHEKTGLSVYAVEEKDSGNIIGAAGFNISGNMETVELIYHFNKNSWGKGYATEAVKACLELANQHGSVKLITASTDDKNVGSLKILKNVGFIYKGTKYFEDSKQDEPYFEYPIGDLKENK